MLFPTDTVSLLKPDGRRFNDIPAAVSSASILINDVNLPIEEGDTILRLLPSGIEERFLVLDPGYRAGLGGRPFYKIAYEKIPNLARRNSVQTIVYNLTGANTRVNIQSHDASVNVVNATPADLFQQMRRAIQAGIEDEEYRRTLLAKTEELERAADAATFLERYQELMALLADHVTQVGFLFPFVLTLAQMLRAC